MASTVPFYVYEFSESICFFEDCSAGEEESSGGTLIDEGEEWCSYQVVGPSPNADPDLCSSLDCTGGEDGDEEDCDEGCDDETEGGGTNSLWFKMRLSASTRRDSATYLWIYQKDAATRLYSPAVLTLPTEEGLQIYRNPDHTIRQIVSQDTLADVVVTSPESYEVRMHPLAADWVRERDAEGWLIPPGEAVRTYRFTNPKPGSVEGLRIDTVVGKSVRTRAFTWRPAENRWSLLSRAGADIRTALLTFGVDASHGYERIHLHALRSLAELISAYALSPVEITRDAKPLAEGVEGFTHQDQHEAHEAADKEKAARPRA